MKRWTRAPLAVVVFLVLMGCGQTTLGTIANLSGVSDLIQSGDLIFVTSSDRDELRAMNVPLSDGNTLRDYIRAPNPLEALSIPVMDFPVELATDRGWDANGNVFAGPYVYARSDGSPELSVVNATDPADLRELRRIYVGSAVTALAGKAPAVPGNPSTLYYATWDGALAVIWAVDLPAAPALVGNAALDTRQVTSLPGTAIRSMLLLPTGELALAMRPTTTQPRASFVLDPVSFNTRDLQFPAPMRKLWTHGSAQGGLVAGQNIWGAYDEEFCDESPTVCPGFYVVNAATGAEVLDVEGQRMHMELGGGLPQALILSSNAHLNGVSGVDDPQIPLLGCYTTSAGAPAPSGGEIHFFDAAKLRQIDTNTAVPAVTAAYTDNNLTPRGYVGGPVQASIALADGATDNEDVVVTYQGLIPGLTDLPRGAADTVLTLPVSGRAVTGDIVLLGPSAAPCSGDLPITVSADGTTATLQGAVPSECPSETLFSVRAMPPLAYPVNGTSHGYMGRTGPNTHFAFLGTYYFHQDSYNPTTPALQFDFTDEDPAIERDWRYDLTLTSGYTPYVVYPDPTVFVDYFLPGAVALDVGINHAFVAYPSTPSVMEMDLTELVAGGANGTESMIEHR